MHLAANSSSSSSISATQHAGRQASSHRPLALPRVQRHRSSPQQQPLLVRSTTTSSNSSNANSSTQLPTLPVNSWLGAHNGAQSAADASKVAKYKRIMLKVSGEALQGSKGFGLDPSVVEAIALEIKAARQHGIQVAVVVGGGNYFRGASAWAGLERATADYVGMLATVMNALCLQVSAPGVTTAHTLTAALLTAGCVRASNLLQQQPAHVRLSAYKQAVVTVAVWLLQLMSCLKFSGQPWQSRTADKAPCMHGVLVSVMQAAVENLGLTSRVQTAIEMREVAEPYIRRRAIRHLENGHVVIFGAGVQQQTLPALPCHSSDTAAASTCVCGLACWSTAGLC